jgi:hypothetical protein
MFAIKLTRLLKYSGSSEEGRIRDVASAIAGGAATLLFFMMVTCVPRDQFE